MKGKLVFKCIEFMNIELMQAHRLYSFWLNDISRLQD